MYLVTYEINDAMLDLLNEEIMQKYLYQKTVVRLLIVKTFPSLLFLCQRLKKKLYGPFLWMGFNCLEARATSRRQFTFYY